MHRPLFLALVALLASACAKAPRTVYADEANYERTGLALAAWNEALARNAGCAHIELALTTDRDAADIVVEMGDAPGKLIGAERDGVVTVDRARAELNPDLLLEVVAHEIGHVLVDEDGWHSDDPADLMYADRASEIDPATGERVGKARAEGPNPTAADVAKVCGAW